MASSLSLTASAESFPIDGRFRIARGERSHAHVIACTLDDGTHSGHGECVPYAHYGETVDGVIAQLESLPALDASAPCDRLRIDLASALPPGAARNAVDCALWDLDAKRSGRRVHALVCRHPPRPVETALTLSLDTPEYMADAARAANKRHLLKMKLGGDEADIARMHAVTANARDARIIVDANESWREDNLIAMMEEAARLHIALVEQPLPVGEDAILGRIPHPVPVCADESAHTSADLDALGALYDVVNIKLDKTGGLTEALAMRDKARRMGFGVMVGCMVGTSLAMAPAVLLAQDADFIDLDGPLLLARDRKPALHYYGSTVSPPEPALWG
ncbi:N-acetyl-D-Glu racemase DgcA [Oceaniradius stylonematis]|uniref:N-acetyl-D-Glu racemase DgcA n=1 Tax=Oceaniradius stylonematis TaxID=2184161 RepID=UPI00273D465E|nr:N-acetyl-D-Glu racemase DgcA [Oceaniradius stylonematis]